MRKNVFFYLLLFATLIFVSCSNDDNNGKIEPKDDIVMTTASGDYYGDSKANSNGQYKLTMSSESGTRAAATAEKLEVVMSLSSKMAFVPFNIVLPAGEYTAAASGEALTFEPGIHNVASDTYTGSYYRHTDTNGVVTTGPIVDGKFTINTEATKSTITAEFTDANAEVLKYKYEGAIPFEDRVEYDAVFTYNNTEFSNVRGYYWGGDAGKPGLFTTLMVSGTPDEWGELEGAGYELGLDSYSDLAEYARFAEITTGTYKVEYTKAIYTSGGGEDRDGWANYFAASYIRERVAGDEENAIMHYVTGGSYNVLVEGEHYYFLIDIVTDKRERFTAKYEGIIKFTDEVTLSSLKADVDMATSSFDKAYMVYKGVEENQGAWELYLLGNGITVGEDGIAGIGKFIQLELSTAPTVTGALEAGVYKVDDKRGDNVTLRGHGYAEFELFFNSWFFEMAMIEWEDEETGEIEEYLGIANYAPIHMGDVTIGKEGINYTVTINATDDYPNKILAKYSGELIFVNGVEESAPSSLSHTKMVRANKLPQVAIAKGKRALK